ncbi:MAG: site-2 protease family protein [Clostridia bacterium]|nr:site-2 protease family protein [Clostridia bacterium]
MTIKINLKIFLFAIIFYLTKQIHLYGMLMFFAFCHEMGHLFCGLLLGLKPKALKIMPMGLSVEFKVLPEEYNKKIAKANRLQIKKMWIAFAGPITNMIIILLSVLLKENIETGLYQEIVYSNILIAIFNLLPIYPLDGARMIKALTYMIKGRKRAMELTNHISNVSIILLTMISSIAIYYYKNIAILLIIGYLWSMVIIENRRYNLKKRIDKIIENS